MSGAHLAELVLSDGTGVWAIRSLSRTVYFLDLDSMLLLRQPGPTSAVGPGDGRWVPLVSVKSLFHGDLGVIRVGDRHHYVYDWDPDGADYGFWIQRLVTSIDYVEAEQLAGLPAFPQDDPL
ncbi:hypothetical protein CHO01_21040 [Cellulomonas hominis]|uniref:Uncharacterized protein n=1 Tax=Cellulomonas hominis TaxID=156981 RepID=A0A511FGK7_9CELL|nr:hypothetical protein [Cellulomonas hominis]MBB5472893.1 hypothetical protein [Cellulomonas hominis]NKY05709.1 hypothetical protein [Cellulomonas hominis]GEL46988.1 hypothetical protein CHO01_21040 [Cellulomonas hominis]